MPDPVVVAHAQAPQGLGQPLGARRHLGEGRLPVPVGLDGDDPAVAVHRLAVTEDAAHEERPVLHRAQHSPSIPVRSSVSGRGRAGAIAFGVMDIAIGARLHRAQPPSRAGHDPRRRPPPAVSRWPPPSTTTTVVVSTRETAMKTKNLRRRPAGLADRLHRQLLRELRPGRGTRRGGVAARGHGRSRGLLPPDLGRASRLGRVPRRHGPTSSGSCCASPSSAPGPTAPAERRRRRCRRRRLVARCHR